ncbi:MAG TPA: hypothetical protein VFV38_30075 [Ktedonobacteraceae bacterium]|nr:hypothetical protein [Ktedonobacteraceae bacterium]
MYGPGLLNTIEWSSPGDILRVLWAPDVLTLTRRQQHPVHRGTVLALLDNGASRRTLHSAMIETLVPPLENEEKPQLSSGEYHTGNSRVI